ncbi:unnamed protein product, partial [marine sediment metagenome]
IGNIDTPRSVAWIPTPLGNKRNVLNVVAIMTLRLSVQIILAKQ